MELSSKAPISDRLSPAPWKEVRQIIGDLRSTWLNQDNFAGALHDYEALIERTSETGGPANTITE